MERLEAGAQFQGESAEVLLRLHLLRGGGDRNSEEREDGKETAVRILKDLLDRVS